MTTTKTRPYLTLQDVILIRDSLPTGPLKRKFRRIAEELEESPEALPSPELTYYKEHKAKLDAGTLSPQDSAQFIQWCIDHGY